MRILAAVLAALLGALLLINTAQAQRIYHQGELDAMLAPIALQPDGVISQVLIASTYPDEVAEAASWSRANPHLRGDDALRAVQYEPWDPAVKALVAFPDLLRRMDESPQWLHDLGEAFVLQEPHVMDTVQSLRRRAQAAGYLANSDYEEVYQQGGVIVVQPRTEVVYVRHYDPYVVYGPWWWPHYRPVFWRPWAPRPVFVASGFFYSKPDWHRRHVHVVHKPVHVPHHVASKPRVVSKPYVRVPESQRRPIVSSAPLAVREHPVMRDTVRKPMPAASAFSQQQHRRGEFRGNAQPRQRDEGHGRARKPRG